MKEMKLLNKLFKTFIFTILGIATLYAGYSLYLLVRCLMYIILL